MYYYIIKSKRRIRYCYKLEREGRRIEYIYPQSEGTGCQREKENRPAGIGQSYPECCRGSEDGRVCMPYPDR